MQVNQHALDRAAERFGIHGINYIKDTIRASKTSFWVLDQKLSYDSTCDITRKQIVVDTRKKAYYVVENHTVVTVLTEEMVMNAFKRGKWSKL